MGLPRDGSPTRIASVPRLRSMAARVAAEKVVRLVMTNSLPGLVDLRPLADALDQRLVAMEVAAGVVAQIDDEAVHRVGVDEVEQLARRTS